VLSLERGSRQSRRQQEHKLGEAQKEYAGIWKHAAESVYLR